MITDANIFFEDGCGRCSRFASDDCSARMHKSGLTLLRQICLSAGLEETAKWGHPCYMAHGCNIAIIGAFQGNFRLSFFNVSLLQDPEGILVKQGANTQHPDMIAFETADDVARKESTIRAYLFEAADYAKRGIKADLPPREIPWPEELTLALDADPQLAEAFHALTPGRKRAYAFYLNQAKQSQTRFARLEKSREKIFAGKGPQER